MLNLESQREIKTLSLHLYGCPKSYTTKDYENLPWYKKILTSNPRSIYEIHKQQTGIFYGIQKTHPII